MQTGGVSVSGLEQGGGDKRLLPPLGVNPGGLALSQERGCESKREALSQGSSPAPEGAGLRKRRCVSEGFSEGKNSPSLERKTNCAPVFWPLCAMMLLSHFSVLNLILLIALTLPPGDLSTLEFCRLQLAPPASSSCQGSSGR